MHATINLLSMPKSSTDLCSCAFYICRRLPHNHIHRHRHHHRHCYQYHARRHAQIQRVGATWVPNASAPQNACLSAPQTSSASRPHLQYLIFFSSRTVWVSAACDTWNWSSCARVISWRSSLHMRLIMTCAHESMTVAPAPAPHRNSHACSNDGHSCTYDASKCVRAWSLWWSLCHSLAKQLHSCTSICDAHTCDLESIIPWNSINHPFIPSIPSIPPNPSHLIHAIHSIRPIRFLHPFHPSLPSMHSMISISPIRSLCVVSNSTLRSCALADFSSLMRLQFRENCMSGRAIRAYGCA